MRNESQIITPELIVKIHRRLGNHASYIAEKSYRSTCSSEEIVHFVSKCMFINKIKNNISK